MIINLFGKKLTIKFEEKKEKKSNVTPIQRDSFVIRMSFIILLLFSIGAVSRVRFYSAKYVIGEVAKKDVISKLTTTFEDDLLKNELIEKIKKNTEKQYKLLPEVENEVKKRISQYINQISMLPEIIDETSLISFVKETGIFLDVKSLRKLIRYSQEELESLETKINSFISDIYNQGIKENKSFLDQVISNNFYYLTTEEQELVTEFIRPNEVVDSEATKELIKRRIEALGTIETTINSGDLILKSGSKVTDRDIFILQKTGEYSSYYRFRILLGTIFYLLIVSGIFYQFGKKYLRDKIIDNRYFYTTMITVALMLLLALAVNHNYFYYVYPFGALILILGILADEKYALIVGGMALLYLTSYEGFTFNTLLLNLIDLCVAIFYLKRIKYRTDIINAGFLIGFVKTLVVLTLSLVFKTDFFNIILYMILTLGSGILSGMITLGILPYFENTFNILTDIKLLELGDLSHPLLKELLMKAPGTFNHSILVATLSEAGAESIGANSTFARVASYYHDVGKTKRPNFFVENQLDGINPHESLKPYLSSLIITSHTKDGEEMAKKYKIPKEIRDIMKEHQGTTLLAYFYNHAKKENPTLSDVDFRYEGPKPKTKESAVIMLADSIEAAVRSMESKNPIAVENMIRKIISSKIEDDQLSEAQLTFKDIEIIIKSFSRVIQGVYHSRIKYPELDKAKRK